MAMRIEGVHENYDSPNQRAERRGFGIYFRRSCPLGFETLKLYPFAAVE